MPISRNKDIEKVDLQKDLIFFKLDKKCKNLDFKMLDTKKLFAFDLDGKFKKCVTKCFTDQKWANNAKRLKISALRHECLFRAVLNIRMGRRCSRGRKKIMMLDHITSGKSYEE